MDFIKLHGLSTWQGTNIVAVLLGALEWAKTLDTETQKWMLPTLWGLLILTFLAIRGNTAPDVAQALNDAGHDDVSAALKREDGE